MSVYDLEFNKDDVLIRNIIIGILASLHDKLNWYSKPSNTEREEVIIPFFFSTTGDERFLQDNFLQDVFYDKNGEIAETAYNQIPRGHVDLTGIEIDPSKTTNHYVRGSYEKQDEDGVLKSYSAEFIPIPLILQMDVTILTDSVLDQFKATEAIIRNFYKSINFQINVNGIRLPATFNLPESSTLERTLEFRSGQTDKKEMKLTFSIDAQVLYPVFKTAENGFKGADDTERFRGNVMNNLTVYGPSASAGVYIDPNLSSDVSLTSNQVPISYNPGEDPVWPAGGSATPLPPQP